MRMMMKVAGLAIGAFTLFAAPAAVAQQYPPSGCSLAASSSTVAPGGAVSVTTTGCSSTSGFAPGSTVTLTLTSDPVQLGTTTADSNGNISASVTIPANTSAGTHTITASGPGASGGTLTVSTSITVAASAAGPTLAFTGNDHAGAFAVAGIGAVLIGGGLVVVSRRRRSDTRA